jgi:hypothetical protein
MNDVSLDQLKQVVERMPHCSAAWVEAELVQEKFHGKTVWNGIVQVFDLSDHPSATRCYWSSPVEGSSKRRFFAVLQTPPVQTAEDAVRAAIIQVHRRAG